LTFLKIAFFFKAFKKKVIFKKAFINPKNIIYKDFFIFYYHVTDAPGL